MIPSRLIMTAFALTLLTACGGGDGIEVRNGPQAVHPSPSALAQGVAATPAPVTYAPALHTYHHHANDGSQPIID